MTRSNPRSEQGPWAFFLPVMLAVAAGILLGDIVRHAAAGAFGADRAPAAPVASDGERASVTGGSADLAGGGDAQVTVGAAKGGDVVVLPGPMTAMRDGADRACINNTIALRRPNGWEQGLEDSVPLRCRAGSP